MHHTAFTAAWVRQTLPPDLRSALIQFEIQTGGTYPSEPTSHHCITSDLALRISLISSTNFINDTRITPLHILPAFMPACCLHGTAMHMLSSGIRCARLSRIFTSKKPNAHTQTYFFGSDIQTQSSRMLGRTYTRYIYDQICCLFALDTTRCTEFYLSHN